MLLSGFVESSKYGRYLLTDNILKDGLFSQQLNIESYWCHMESMAASNYMECKVNQQHSLNNHAHKIKKVFRRGPKSQSSIANQLIFLGTPQKRKKTTKACMSKRSGKNVYFTVGSFNDIISVNWLLSPWDNQTLF